tara:strand:+ start:580 stop:774 length:195 start_codon:yes stop_codon:yes gene_type:complete
MIEIIRLVKDGYRQGKEGRSKSITKDFTSGTKKNAFMRNRRAFTPRANRSQKINDSNGGAIASN